MMLVVPVAVAAVSAAAGSLVYSRLGRRWPAAGWPLIGALCAVAALLGVAIGVYNAGAWRLGSLPVTGVASFTAACTPLTALLRDGSPTAASTVRFGRTVVGYLICVTSFVIAGAVVGYIAAIPLFK